MAYEPVSLRQMYRLVGEIRDEMVKKNVTQEVWFEYLGRTRTLGRQVMYDYKCVNADAAALIPTWAKLSDVAIDLYYELRTWAAKYDLQNENSTWRGL